MVQLLLDHHADANAATPEGYTPLMTASMLGSPAIVSALLRKGANVNARSSDGQTALSLALANSNLIAHYDRPRSEPPYIDIPEAELLKQTQAKHAQVIEMLKVAGAR
jgi:ankyrin repeat protein